MKKKLLTTILASVCAAACAFGLAACGGNEPNKDLTEAEYKAYLEGVRNMPSFTIKYFEDTIKDDDNSISRNAYVYVDAENEKSKLHTYSYTEVDGEYENYRNYTDYYAIEGDKAYAYLNQGYEKCDITEEVAARGHGDTLWDKLVDYKMLNEHVIMLDNMKFINENHPEGLVIDEIFNELTWESSYSYSSKKEPAIIGDKEYAFGYRWRFTGAGTFDIEIGEETRENVTVEIQVSENEETGKLLSKDYTDGSFSIDMRQEGDDIDTWRMSLTVYTFNLWYISFDNEDVFEIPEEDFYMNN